MERGREGGKEEVRIRCLLYTAREIDSIADWSLDWLVCGGARGRGNGQFPAGQVIRRSACSSSSAPSLFDSSPFSLKLCFAAPIALPDIHLGRNLRSTLRQAQTRALPCVIGIVILSVESF